MDLPTLLSARREADRGAQPIPDVAAAERALLASAADPPGPPWIADAARVVAEHQRQGRAERVWPLLRVLEPRLPQLDAAGAGRVHAAFATQALLEGDAEAFLDRARRAAEAFDQAGDAAAASVERAALGGGLLALGANEEAEGALDAAIAAADQADLVIATAAARLDRARLALRGRAYEEARALAAKAVEGFAAGGDRRLEGLARAALATALAGAQRGDEAIAEARQALDAAGGTPEASLAATALGRALFTAGRREEATAVIGEPATGIGWLAGGLAPVWIALADGRTAAGDAAGATAAEAEARRAVLAFASKIRSPALRRSYLERIPEHRRALGLAPL